MAQLDSKLDKLLSKHKVDEKVREYLVAKGRLTLGEFAGLADSKPDVADGICVPAGLSATDRLVCGPVKCAWQEAEAYVIAELEQIKKGKFTDLDDPIDAEVRIKKTTNFNGYYHLRLPAHLLGCDSLAGRCGREHDRKIPTARDVMKVKSLAHKPDGGDNDSGGADDEEFPRTRFKFIYKHRVLMNTLALAVAPDWHEADWSILLDYHEWMVLKLFEERKGQLPPLAAVVDADHKMRTKWIEAMRNDRVTMTDAIKLCRTEYVSLFADLHDHAAVPAKRAGGESSTSSSQKRERRELPRVEVDPKTNKKICTFYNNGKCTFGQRCKFAHVCNVRGCGVVHMASENHTA